MIVLVYLENTFSDGKEVAYYFINPFKDLPNVR